VARRRRRLPAATADDQVLLPEILPANANPPPSRVDIIH
jgi:hypothetical protein